MCLDLGRAISIVMEHFCVLPFFAKEIKWNGDSTPCCLLPMDAHVDIVQQHMLAGRRAPESHRCWRLEDQGLVSERQRKNAELDHYLDRDLAFIQQDAENGDRTVRMLKLFTSSTCNSTCSTCNFAKTRVCGRAVLSTAPGRRPSKESAYQFCIRVTA